MTEIINKIELSGIVTLDLMTYKPTETEYVAFDITTYMTHGYLLQEKPFRTAMDQIDWTKFHNQEVIIYCSNDAIVPYWAYVLVRSLLQPYARFVGFCEAKNHTNLVWKSRIDQIDYTLFQAKKVVLKASSDIPPELYIAATGPLMEQVQSLMWGEAGSPLMIYKKKK